MKRLLVLVLTVLLLTIPVRADWSKDLTDALPSEAESLLEDALEKDSPSLETPESFAHVIGTILEKAGRQVHTILRQRLRGAISILFVAALCGMVDGFGAEFGKTAVRFLPMAGALSVSLVTAGSLDDLIGMGSRTIQELSDFSQVLLPTLAAATAASGAVTTATVQQVTTVFCVDLLLRLIHGLLLPLVYLYIGVLTASACLPESRLGIVADGMKK